MDIIAVWAAAVLALGGAGSFELVAVTYSGDLVVVGIIAALGVLRREAQSLAVILFAGPPRVQKRVPFHTPPF